MMLHCEGCIDNGFGEGDNISDREDGGNWVTMLEGCIVDHNWMTMQIHKYLSR